MGTDRFGGARGWRSPLATMGTDRRLLALGPAVVLAIGCAAVEFVRPDTGISEAIEAGLAGLVAALALVVALTLPGVTWRGAVFGGVFVTAGILSWTLMTRPTGIWV